MGKDWLKKKGLYKWFQRDNLIILVLSGILLFIIALPIEEENGDGQKKEETVGLQQNTKIQLSERIQEDVGKKETVNTAVSGEAFDYAAYLEERLEKMLGGVSGVGKVSVMITLQSSEELVLEKDEPVKRSNVQETDSAGGSRVTSQLETNETTIYRTTGSDSEPYVVKRILPRVEGVLVVAQGAGKGNVNKSITEIVQALFDVEVHKVQVVKMSESK